MNRKGKVFFREIFAGEIFENENGYIFQYDTSYLNNETYPPISFTLLKRKEAYQSKTLFPFFDGLIPEGWLLSLTQNIWKLNKKDRFGILLTVCEDCIGAVSVVGQSR
ncbi:HipA N-terminal domain-containing protein [Leptospira sp. 2 VSF19]|uniref:HipA N-terminal domain-containing protein n=1 Tax=Leptospira soteropolitanensis TaxID=2950025 RepID=A0AAW5VKQ1_9LEPT|nr:HipA N-terminal domain-containing protein [Leptospira soteropolitanensis]MCW7492539.1 HipA N-terminal domain-containing protein [Leptospira soteropolitanensis]MCW7500587.1 HipA N-terminal domain-containing protein [Leptospira soteropolitanensis]MCW7522743.1 HipA N-terminal domain-containing protein [Leptospira soteropolitanensis]MCW7526599.1 HipA N-terminal domain-containing protein [Leptospira soteropolitanensis]MCW7530557.1 HipA N-terminal domain-containing protein [Leptospira soteropolit